MTDITTLPIELLRRRTDARKLNDGALASLAESIEEIGLINPIRVRRVDEAYEVIAGSHRFAACDLVGLQNIPCIIVKDDDLHAELAMIDENLMRAELSASDRAATTARRKAIYLELHPETDHGGNSGGPSGQFVRTVTNSFTTETAKATGRDERTVRRDAERGEKVIDEALSIVRGTKLDTGVYLDKLKKLSPDDQVTAAKRDLAIEKRRAEEPRTRGGLAARYQQTTPDPAKSAEWFVSLVDQIEAIPVEELLSTGRMRATVGQRASGLADHLSEIVERLDR